MGRRWAYLGYCVGGFGLFWAKTCYAGAWNLPAKRGQVINTTLFDTANRQYDESGQLADLSGFQKFESSIFWEHGLDDKTTLVTQFGVQDVSITNMGSIDTYRGVSESGIALRRHLGTLGKWVVSAQAGVVVGAGGENISDGPLGFGDTHVELRALAGRGFKFAGKNGFIDVQSAWRWRFQDSPNDWRVDGTLGLRPFENILVMGQGFFVQTQGLDGFVRKNERLKLQGSLVYDRSKRTSYQIGVYQTVAGRSTIKEKALFLGVWTRY